MPVGSMRFVAARDPELLRGEDFVNPIASVTQSGSVEFIGAVT